MVGVGGALLEHFACHDSDWWNYLLSIMGNVVFHHKFSIKQSF